MTEYNEITTHVSMERDSKGNIKPKFSIEIKRLLDIEGTTFDDMMDLISDQLKKSEEKCNYYMKRN